MKTFYTLLLAFVTGLGFSQNKTVAEGTLTNLYDAFGKDTSLRKDFGFSCILKYNSKTILFDAGGNADFFKQNVQRLGIDLKLVDVAIVSHGHFDHLNGLDYLLEVNPQVKIYMPYDIFWGAPVPFDATGSDTLVRDSLPVHMLYFDGGKTKFVIPQSGRFWKANVEYVKASKEIFQGVRLVATNSPYLGYFSGYPNNYVTGQFDQHNQGCDYIKFTNLPELSLSLKTEKGEVIVVGCSHSGVERIIKQTKEETQNKIELVYGGFHMIPFKRAEVQQFCNYMKNDLGVQRVAPAHCSGHLAFSIFQKAFGSNYIYAGLGETISYK